MGLRDRITDFRRVPASQIEGAPWNWRTHPTSQKAAVKASLDELGIIDALRVRELPGGRYQLWDGHLREELYAGVGPETLVPILVTDLNESEAKKANAVFDPLAAMAEANAEQLDALLREVETGSEALAEMLQELAKDAGCEWAKTGEVVEDEVPEPPAVPFTRPGDLWVLGEHRLLCGDSTKAEDVGRLLGNRKPFIMVTDPPYGVEYDADWRLEAGINKPWQTLASGKVQNDDRADWTAAYKLFTGHVAYVWHADKYAADLVVNLRDAAFEIRTQIIWSKPSLVMSRGHYHWQHEPCWYAVRKGGSAKWCGDRKQSTLWQIPNMHRTQGDVDDGKTVHSTQKPVECMARPIRNHGGPEDDVYDPFLGSGTTIIAAEQLGRRCYAIELEPAYVDVGLARWHKLTGKVPVRESDGAEFPVQLEAIHA